MNARLCCVVKRGAVAALMAAVIAACGGGGGDGTPTTGNVGPDGATLGSVDGNATLVVPPGALNSTIAVTLAPATEVFQSDPQLVPGTAYQLEAPATALAKQATLSLLVPDSVAAGGSVGTAQKGAHDARALGALDPSGLISCTPAVAPGADVPAGTVCMYQAALFFKCPSSVPLLLGAKTIAIPPFAFELVELCQAPFPSKVQAVELSPDAPPATLPTELLAQPNRAQVMLDALSHKLIGLLLDTTPPTVQLSSTVQPLGNGQGRLTLTVSAIDNAGVTKVALFRAKFLSGGDTEFADFVAPPYSWTSPVMPLSDIYAFGPCGVSGCDFTIYYAVAYDKAGNAGEDITGLGSGPPQIKTFGAAPAAVPTGGADTVLSWAVDNAQTLVIDHGIGDVTGLASKTVHVGSPPATYTLTATNPSGTVTATTTVAVAPRPAPTIVSFTATPQTLPAGGGLVTLAWTTTDADSLTIDNGVGVVTGNSAVVNVTSTTDFILTATNTTGSVTKDAKAIVAVSTDRFVDVNTGSDANACTQSAPCKTIGQGLSGAPLGSTVWLASGVYDTTSQGAAGETIPDGVTVQASSPGGAIVSNGPLVAAGSAAIVGIVLDRAAGSVGSITATSATGTPVLLLTGVLFKHNDVLTLAGNVRATMTPGSLAGGLYTAALSNDGHELIHLAGTAELLIQGGIIDGNATASSYSLITASGSSKLTLDGATIRDRPVTAITAQDNAAVALKNSALIDNVTGGIITSGSNNISLDSSQISNYVTGILVGNTANVPSIRVKNSSISHGAPPPLASAAIQSQSGGADAVVMLDGATLTNNYCGIRWAGLSTATNFDIMNSAITGNGGCGGMQLAGLAGSLTLRTSNVSSNGGPGISIFSPAWVLDFGTQASPGLNSLTGNSDSSLSVSLTSGSIAVQAVGNVWTPNLQGADANGRYSTPPTYAPVPETGPSSGQNFHLSGGVTANL